MFPSPSTVLNPNTNIAEIERALLLPNGKLRLMPAKEIDALPRDALRLFCHKYARYGLPTLELIQYLKDLIGNRTAIEIGAGAGDFGYHLGIPMTDNKCQNWPDVRQYYAALNQPPVVYGEDVEEIDALEAVKKYNPQVVFGSWVTQWIDPNQPPPPGGGSVYGVREAEILERVENYVVVGNLAIHGFKKILSDPARWPYGIGELPFIRSRASDPSLDRLFVWGKQ